MERNVLDIGGAEKIERSRSIEPDRTPTGKNLAAVVQWSIA